MLRPLRKSLCFYTLAVVLFTALCLFILNYIQSNYESDLSSNIRCLSELDSLKYQLNVVTEYKNRLDKLLTETQRKYDTEKEGLKEIVDSCLAMKQQTAICQSQFEDLQVECTKVREDLDQCTKHVEKLKPAR